ncbi:MAG TPA: PEP-CTERM sorting domain-containing protein [Verrucomicrobiae bacterium]|nr:PEP-CTERM sorting domain-containing protein [Verrucomicrobiae bacterium]
MKLLKSLTILASVAALAGVSAQAQVITEWTFESTVPTNAGPYAAEIGTGSALGYHTGAAVYSNPAGNGSTESFSVNTWAVGDYFEFSSSTVGYTGIDLEWDQTSSGTGPGTFSLSYSTDGTSFTTVGSDYTVLANSSPNPLWSTSTYHPEFHYSVDLSSITALDNAPAVYFRLTDDSTTSANGGTVAASGTDRVDNFSIQVVPEPCTAALLGLGSLGLIFANRRKH